MTRTAGALRRAVRGLRRSGTVRNHSGYSVVFSMLGFGIAWLGFGAMAFVRLGMLLFNRGFRFPGRRPGGRPVTGWLAFGTFPWLVGGRGFAGCAGLGRGFAG